jgi:hypothetical protein
MSTRKFHWHRTVCLGCRTPACCASSAPKNERDIIIYTPKGQSSTSSLISTGVCTMAAKALRWLNRPCLVPWSLTRNGTRARYCDPRSRDPLSLPNWKTGSWNYAKNMVVYFIMWHWQRWSLCRFSAWQTVKAFHKTSPTCWPPPWLGIGGMLPSTHPAQRRAPLFPISWWCIVYSVSKGGADWGHRLWRQTA